MKPGISVVFPALNEAANLAAVDRCLSVASRHSSDSEIIIITNDGSTDPTGQVAGKLAEAYSPVREGERRWPTS